MEKFKIGTLMFNRKYLVQPPVYRDWRYWSINNLGGIAFMNAVKSVTGYNLACDWYGSPENPCNMTHTTTPTEYQITFCGCIDQAGIIFDIGVEIGEVNFYKWCNPIDVEREQDSMSLWIQQMSALLADNSE